MSPFPHQRIPLLSFLAAILLLLSLARGIGCLEPLLQYPTGGRICSSPVLSTFGTIYAVSEDRYLYCIDHEGRLVWRFPLRDRVGESLVLGLDQTAYLTMRDGTVFAVNPKGKELFRLPLGEPILHELCADPKGHVYALLRNGSLVSFSHRGRIRWNFPLPAMPAGSPLFNGTDIVVPLADSRLIAVSTWGSESWSVDLNGAPSYLCAEERGTVFASTAGGSIYRVDRYGVVLGEDKTGIGAPSILIGEDGVALLFSGNDLLLLDGAGIEAWRKTPGFPISWCRMGEGTIDAFSMDGRFARYGLNGMELEHGSLEREELLFNAGNGNGILCAGSGDWNIYGWKGGGNSAGEWPQPGKDQGKSRAIRRTSSDDGRITVTGEYLYLKSLAESDDPAMKQAALDAIREIIGSGDLAGRERLLIEILESMAGEAAFSPRYFMDRQVNDLPAVRMQAVSLLSAVCGTDTAIFLRDLLLREQDTVVIAAIIQALGTIGSDIEGSSIRAIGEAIRKREVSQDPGIVLAAVMALEAINAYHGFLPDSSGLEILFSAAHGRYPLGIRKYALEVIRKMRE